MYRLTINLKPKHDNKKSDRTFEELNQRTEAVCFTEK